VGLLGQVGGAVQKSRQKKGQKKEETYNVQSHGSKGKKKSSAEGIARRGGRHIQKETPALKEKLSHGRLIPRKIKPQCCKE